MNSNTFRLAALVAAAAPVALLVASPAYAHGATTASGGGKASAVVLRTALDVSLLNKTVDVPLKATLNEVQAPASADETALSVRLDGVDRGRQVSVLRADVATADATVGKRRAEGHSNLVNARLYVPGLPLLSLIEVEKVSSEAVCVVGRRPVAESNVLGHVRVLGRRITLSAGGTTRVHVPGVGEVTLDLSKTRTTSRTAAAVALQLKVSVNPLKLNVADVQGEVTLAEATCRTPKADGPHSKPTKPAGSTGGDSEGGSGTGGDGSTGGDSNTGGDGSTGGSSTGGSSTGGDSGDDVKTQTGTGHAPAAVDTSLAETGSSSATPYVAGGAAFLLALGGGAMVVARRRAQD
ncbi:SCO1860 family LAETG-anchored protein [Streptomyces sp. LN785]|uniref:SCO1860 family LAETG-anchored protein n=1 Tax=Streptomyces sp. LN785 TaxID=3112983 RepID=UPI0037153A0D